MIETRNGSDQVVTQHVWDNLAPGSGHYIDSLAEVTHNLNPGYDEDGITSGTQDFCEARLFAMQDQQFNVLGLVTADGTLAERYEYTLYGKRQVFKSTGLDLADLLRCDLNGDGTVDSADVAILDANLPLASGATRWDGDTNNDGDVDSYDEARVDAAVAMVMDNRDAKAMTPSSGSTVVPYSGAKLCTIGFQGLRHDETTGLIDNRARVYDPLLQRFLQRDPLGYPDGMNTYTPYHVLRGGLDPWGLAELTLSENGWLTISNGFDQHFFEYGGNYYPGIVLTTFDDYIAWKYGAAQHGFTISGDLDAWAGSHLPISGFKNLLASGDDGSQGCAAHGESESELVVPNFTAGPSDGARRAANMASVIPDGVSEEVQKIVLAMAFAGAPGAQQVLDYSQSMADRGLEAAPEVITGIVLAVLLERYGGRVVKGLFGKLSNKLKGKADDCLPSGPSPHTPVGRRGEQHVWPNPDAPKPRNVPANIGGRDYSGHAIDRMQERGFTPSVVEDAIQRGGGVAGVGEHFGTTLYTVGENGIKVAVDDATGTVVTVISTSVTP